MGTLRQPKLKHCLIDEQELVDYSVPLNLFIFEKKKKAIIKNSAIIKAY